MFPQHTSVSRVRYCRTRHTNCAIREHAPWYACLCGSLVALIESLTMRRHSPLHSSHVLLRVRSLLLHLLLPLPLLLCPRHLSSPSCALLLPRLAYLSLKLSSKVCRALHPHLLFIRISSIHAEVNSASSPVAVAFIEAARSLNQAATQ